jgi:hypothetical protein
LGLTLQFYNSVTRHCVHGALLHETKFSLFFNRYSRASIVKLLLRQWALAVLSKGWSTEKWSQFQYYILEKYMESMHKASHQRQLSPSHSSYCTLSVACTKQDIW